MTVTSFTYAANRLRLEGVCQDRVMLTKVWSEDAGRETGLAIENRGHSGAYWSFVGLVRSAYRDLETRIGHDGATDADLRAMGVEVGHLTF